MNWMKYCQNPDDAIPVMRIFDVVGERMDYETGFTRGINGNDFATELAMLEATGKAVIEVHINSQGGSILDGMTIYQAIKNAKIPVNTVCVGVAVSIAGVILQAGKERSMTEWGKMMIHNPSGGDVKELAELKDTIIKMICPRTGISEDEMSDIMDSTEWYGCEECLEMKLIDKIYVLENDKEKSEVQMSSLHLQKIVNEQKPTQMKSVIAVLQAQGFSISESSNEGDFLKAINSLIKAKNEAEDKVAEGEDFGATIKKLTDEKKEAEDALNKKNEELEDALNKKKELEDSKKESEDKAMKVEATNAVDLAIKGGKLKSDVKTEWVAMYMEDKEMTVKLLNGMTGTRMAANVSRSTEGAGNGTETPKSTISGGMAAVRKRVEAENKKRLEQAS